MGYCIITQMNVKRIHNINVIWSHGESIDYSSGFWKRHRALKYLDYSYFRVISHKGVYQMLVMPSAS